MRVRPPPTPILAKGVAESHPLDRSWVAEQPPIIAGKKNQGFWPLTMVEPPPRATGVVWPPHGRKN
jgi:hypothetical protein